MAGRRRPGRSKTRGVKRALRSRNPLALPTRLLGRQVKPSKKLYRRCPKHRDGEDG